MTATECIEIIASADSGAIFSDEMRGNPQFLIGVLDAGRSHVIRTRYKNSQTIHPNFKQLVYPKFDLKLQEYEEGLTDDKCYSTFKLERSVDVNDLMDGYLSCGTFQDRNFDFIRIKSRSEYSNLLKQEMGRLMLNKKHHWFPDPSSRRLYVYDSNGVHAKKIKYEIIAEHPTKVDGFNIEKDDYPITMDGLKMVEEMVRQGTIYGYLKVKSNKVSNSQDDAQITNEV